MPTMVSELPVVCTPPVAAGVLSGLVEAVSPPKFQSTMVSAWAAPPALQAARTRPMRPARWRFFMLGILGRLSDNKQQHRSRLSHTGVSKVMFM